LISCLTQLPALPALAQSDADDLDLKIDHVGISVANLEESVNWYVEKLGFELTRPLNRNPNSTMNISARLIVRIETPAHHCAVRQRDIHQAAAGLSVLQRADGHGDIHAGLEGG
jgi:hypothetical protein